jgi:hypothetical protein
LLLQGGDGLMSWRYDRAAAQRHDGTDDLPEHESNRFDDSADAWVHKKTKFENKGGKVVMHTETTTYSKGA